MTISKKLLLIAAIGLSIPFNASISAQPIQQQKNAQYSIHNFDAECDADLIEDIIRENKYWLLPSDIDDSSVRHAVQNFLQVYSNNDPQFYKINVLRENNTFAGFIAYRKVDEKNEGFIDGLAIAHDFRNKGYGTTLLKHAIEEFHQMKVSSIALATSNDNISALNLYQKVGFKKTSEDD